MKRTFSVWFEVEDESGDSIDLVINRIKWAVDLGLTDPRMIRSGVKAQSPKIILTKTEKK